MKSPVKFRSALRNRPVRVHREPRPALAVAVVLLITGAAFALWSAYLPQ